MYKQKLPVTNIYPEPIKRLNYRLPDHTRMAYAAGEVREYWKPRIEHASREWLEIERLTLLEGIRDSILVTVNSSQAAEVMSWAARNDFHVHVARSFAAGNSYSSYGGSNPAPGENYTLRLAICRKKEDLGRWASAYKDNDDVTVGELLGYPKCCREFFDTYWNEQEFRDLTAPAWMNSDPKKIDWRSNILGRWAGIRLVSSMPCSFHCEASIDIAQQTLDAAKIRHRQAIETIEQVLRMPFSYSCLHGIAEIMTPVFKVSAASEATSSEFRFEIPGESPELAASGTVHPFTNKRGKKGITEGKRYERAIEAMRTITETDPARYKLNGFSSAEAMHKAHAPILDLIYPGEGDVFDFGAGTGELAVKAAAITGGTAAGVEFNEVAVKWSRDNDIAAYLVYNDIFSPEYDPAGDVAVLMRGRLEEVEDPGDLIDKIKKTFKFLIVYAYGDWIEKVNAADLFDEDLTLLDYKKTDHVHVARYQINPSNDA